MFALSAVSAVVDKDRQNAVRLTDCGDDDLAAVFTRIFREQHRIGIDRNADFRAFKVQSGACDKSAKQFLHVDCRRNVDAEVALSVKFVFGEEHLIQYPCAVFVKSEKCRKVFFPRDEVVAGVLCERIRVKRQVQIYLSALTEVKAVDKDVHDFRCGENTIKVDIRKLTITVRVFRLERNRVFGVEEFKIAAVGVARAFSLFKVEPENVQSYVERKFVIVVNVKDADIRAEDERIFRCMDAYEQCVENVFKTCFVHKSADKTEHRFARDIDFCVAFYVVTRNVVGDTVVSEISPDRRNAVNRHFDVRLRAVDACAFDVLLLGFVVVIKRGCVVVGVCRVVYLRYVLAGFRIVFFDIPRAAIRHFHEFVNRFEGAVCVLRVRAVGVLLVSVFCINGFTVRNLYVIANDSLVKRSPGYVRIAGSQYVIFPDLYVQVGKFRISHRLFVRVFRLVAELFCVFRAEQRVARILVCAVAYVQVFAAFRLIVDDSAGVVSVNHSRLVFFVQTCDFHEFCGRSGVNGVCFVIYVGVRLLLVFNPRVGRTERNGSRRAFARDKSVDKVKHVYARDFEHTEVLVVTRVLFLEEVRYVNVKRAFRTDVGKNRKRYVAQRRVDSRKGNSEINRVQRKVLVFQAVFDADRRFDCETNVDIFFDDEFGFKVADNAAQNVCKSDARLLVNLDLTFQTKRDAGNFVCFRKGYACDFRRRNNVFLCAEFGHIDGKFQVRRVRDEIKFHKPVSGASIELRRFVNFAELFDVFFLTEQFDMICYGVFEEYHAVILACASCVEIVLAVLAVNRLVLVFDPGKVYRKAAECDISRHFGQYFVVVINVFVQNNRQYRVDKLCEVVVLERDFQSLSSNAYAIDDLFYDIDNLTCFDRCGCFVRRKRGARTRCRPDDIHKEFAGNFDVGHSESVKHQVYVAVRDVDTDKLVAVGLCVNRDLRFYERQRLFDRRENIRRIEALLQFVEKRRKGDFKFDRRADTHVAVSDCADRRYVGENRLAFAVENGSTHRHTVGEHCAKVKVKRQGECFQFRLEPDYLLFGLAVCVNDFVAVFVFLRSKENFDEFDVVVDIDCFDFFFNARVADLDIFDRNVYAQKFCGFRVEFKRDVAFALKRAVFVIDIIFLCFVIVCVLRAVIAFFRRDEFLAEVDFDKCFQVKTAQECLRVFVKTERRYSQQFFDEQRADFNRDAVAVKDKRSRRRTEFVVSYNREVDFGRKRGRRSAAAKQFFKDFDAVRAAQQIAESEPRNADIVKSESVEFQQDVAVFVVNADNGFFAYLFVAFKDLTDDFDCGNRVVDVRKVERQRNAKRQSDFRAAFGHREFQPVFAKRHTRKHAEIIDEFTDVESCRRIGVFIHEFQAEIYFKAQVDYRFLCDGRVLNFVGHDGLCSVNQSDIDFADVKVEPDAADFKPDADTERIEVEAEFQFFVNAVDLRISCGQCFRVCRIIAFAIRKNTGFRKFDIRHVCFRLCNAFIQRLTAEFIFAAICDFAVFAVFKQYVLLAVVNFAVRERYKVIRFLYVNFAVRVFGEDGRRRNDGDFHADCAERFKVYRAFVKAEQGFKQRFDKACRCLNRDTRRVHAVEFDEFANPQLQHCRFVRHAFIRTCRRDCAEEFGHGHREDTATCIDIFNI